MATVPTCKPLWHVKSVMIVTSDITTRPINNLVHQSAHYLEGPLNNCFASPVQFSEWSLSTRFWFGTADRFQKTCLLTLYSFLVSVDIARAEICQGNITN